MPTPVVSVDVCRNYRKVPLAFQETTPPSLGVVILCSPEYRAFNLSTQSQLDSSHRRCAPLYCHNVSVSQLWQLDTQQLGRKTAVDEQLRNLIDEVCRYPDPSPERQKALNRLLIVIQQLPGIYKSSHPDYAEALNLTWEWVSRKIGEFKPRESSVQQSLVTWINGYLKWRVRDLYAKDNQYSVSLDRPISNDEGDQTTLLDQIPDRQFTTPTLDLLEVKILQIQEAQRQRLGQQLRQYIEQDEERKLTDCHPRKHPECNCQLLARRLLLQEPPERIADISREFDVSNQTLYSHWKNNCLPLLQDIGRKFGYQP